MSKEYENFSHRALIRYTMCVNQIEDFLEYRYKNCSQDEIKEYIMSKIDKVTSDLKNDMDNTSKEQVTK